MRFNNKNFEMCHNFFFFACSDRQRGQKKKFSCVNSSEARSNEFMLFVLQIMNAEKKVRKEEVTNI